MSETCNAMTVADYMVTSPVVAERVMGAQGDASRELQRSAVAVRGAMVAHN